MSPALDHVLLIVLILTEELVTSCSNCAADSIFMSPMHCLRWKAGENDVITLSGHAFECYWSYSEPQTVFPQTCSNTSHIGTQHIITHHTCDQHFYYLNASYYLDLYKVPSCTYRPLLPVSLTIRDTVSWPLKCRFTNNKKQVQVTDGRSASPLADMCLRKYCRKFSLQIC